MNKVNKIVWIIFDVLTAMVGYQIHGSVFWAFIDLFFSPLAWLKWVVCREVTLTIIYQALSWFLQ